MDAGGRPGRSISLRVKRDETTADPRKAFEGPTHRTSAGVARSSNGLSITRVVLGRALTAGSDLSVVWASLWAKSAQCCGGRSGTKAKSRRNRRAGRLQHPDHDTVRSHAVQTVFCTRSHDLGFANGERASADTKPWPHGISVGPPLCRSVRLTCVINDVRRL